jgi:hypothetical protein
MVQIINTIPYVVAFIVVVYCISLLITGLKDIGEIDDIMNEPKKPALQQGAVIGSAFVRGQWKDVELIDESKVDLVQRVRVIWRDEQNRRVTSFVSPSEVKKHCL